jgi:hypothetical protein
MSIGFYAFKLNRLTEVFVFHLFSKGGVGPLGWETRTFNVIIFQS